jgi:hypothetical protein
MPKTSNSEADMDAGLGAVETTRCQVYHPLSFFRSRQVCMFMGTYMWVESVLLASYSVWALH